MYRSTASLLAALVAVAAAVTAQQPPPREPTTPAEERADSPEERAQVEVDEVAGATTAPRRFRVEPASSPIVIDGVLDEAAWQQAEVIPLPFEYFPADNVPAPVVTEARVTFDRSHVYVSFRALDPEPSAIRANLMDRDSINTFVQDDHVVFMIDPFDDERRAFQFRVNPLGVQADAIFSQIEGVEDFSWDIIWESAGRITEEGYVVEAAIPTNQLRFPAGGEPQTWGFDLGRSWPRSVRHRLSATPRDRNNNCLLCQVAKLTGFRGLEPGLNLELDPTVTARRTDTHDAFPEGGLQSGDEDFQPGLTARWGVTPSITLNATINPDFSQVEADVAQLAVNERFALFFPEKRPFFLEGIDFFATPIDAVFTRSVVNPDWGLKVTGKQGRHAGGAFVTRDEVDTLVIPSNQGSAFALLEDEITAGVLRYRRDVGSNSTLGVLYAGREGDGYHNRVGGVDGFLRFGPTDEVRFQYLRSDTLYPGGLAAAFGQSLESFDDDALRVQYNHNQRSWFTQLRWEDLGPGFRADSGFVPRVDVRTASGVGGYVFWPDPGAWWNRADVALSVVRTENHAGDLTDERYDLAGSISGPRQSFLQLSLENNSERVGEVLYQGMRRAESYFEIQPTGAGKYTLYLDYGETVDYANNRPGDVFVAVPSAELKLGRHVNTRLQHTLQRLEVEGGELFEAHLSQLRVVYNFSVRSFLRAIVQYTDIARDPRLYLSPVEPQTETVFTQLLFSYKLNAQTVLFVGYSDNHLGLDRVDLTQTDRTFFVKVGYAWTL
ncbi:MAG TPA: DUF5916 domain-containing protein [Thermoanaerobaculia bacterium]|nr:DUF5916 domain-containing protein [Thermoanaerobaculia bacterium]